MFGREQPERQLSPPCEEGKGVENAGLRRGGAWSPDGSRLAAASDFGGTITVWDRSGRQISQFKRNGGGPALGGWIAFAAGSSEILFEPPDGVPDSVAFTIWDVASGRVVRSVDGPEATRDYPSNRATHLGISDSQDQVLLATLGLKDSPTDTIKDVSLYDTYNWRIIHSYSTDNIVSALTTFWRSDDFALGAFDGSVTVFRDQHESPPSTYHAFEVSKYGQVSVGAVAANPAGSLIFAGPDGAYVDGPLVGTPELIAWEKTNFPARVLTPSGKTLASFSVASGLVKAAVWDPLDRYVAFIDGVGSLYLWRPRAPTLSYLRIALPGSGFALAISPDGREIAATADAGVVIYSVQ